MTPSGRACFVLGLGAGGKKKTKKFSFLTHRGFDFLLQHHVLQTLVGVVRQPLELTHELLLLTRFAGGTAGGGLNGGDLCQVPRDHFQSGEKQK